MFFWALNLCVISCELFSIDPSTTVNNIPSNYYADLDAAVRSSEAGTADFPNPLDWSLHILDGVCSSCYSKWQDTYVNDASQYTDFLLYTRKSGGNYSIFGLNDTQALLNQGFDPSKDTKIIIHGWVSNGSTYFAELMRIAYLDVQDVNVIAVNWPELSTQFYTLARCAIEPVGQYTAHMVDFLIKEVGVVASSIHVVGHSLGAHIAGFTGKFVTFGKLPRITGLDPAGPLIPEDPSGRLDKTDADFVDVIHTCAGYLGYFDDIGTVDFYPNGGFPNQPGCGVDVTVCAHDRSYDLFAESITSLGFVGTQCDHWHSYKDGDCSNNTKCVMGEHVDLSAQGVFYLFTNGESPYAAWNSSLSLPDMDAEDLH